MKILKTILTRNLPIALTILVISYDYAWAYIDPSTGSYIIQMLIAGVLGSLFVLKTFWGNIKGFFSKKSSYKKDQK